MIQISMTLIATTTLASAASSIDFTSIPATYTDLLVVFSGRSTATGDAWNDAKIIFNSSTSSYSARVLYGTGNGVGSVGGTSQSYGWAGWMDSNSATSNTFSNISIYIPNYAGSTNKSYSVDSVEESNATNAFSGLVAGLWGNTAAITSVSLGSASGATLMQYSTASLYGIQKGSGGATVSP